jgi:hypothetical protein
VKGRDVKYTATAAEFKETLEQAQRIIDGDEPFEPEFDYPDPYMGSDSDFSDHALGIDY